MGYTGTLRAVLHAQSAVKDFGESGSMINCHAIAPSSASGLRGILITGRGARLD